MKLLYELQHSLATLVAIALGYLISYPMIAGISVFFYFVGREIAQAEYRWIKQFGNGKRTNMHWYAPFDLKVWDVHSWWWNLTLPMIITLIFSIVIN